MAFFTVKLVGELAC